MDTTTQTPQTKSELDQIATQQTNQDFKHAVLLASLLVNAATLTVWLVYAVS